MKDNDVLSLIGLCTVLAFAGAPVHSSAESGIPHYRFDIPRESLDAALKAFARQTGLQVARFSDVGSSNTQVGPVSGSLTSEQALKMLLADSGLTYQELNQDTIAVVNQQDMADASRIRHAPAQGPGDDADISGRKRHVLPDQQLPTSSTQLEEVAITGTRRTAIVLHDKKLTIEEIKHLSAQGYKPVSRNGEVVYCRREEVMGSHFEKMTCRTSDQIKQITRDGREWTEATIRISLQYGAK